MVKPDNMDSDTIMKVRVQRAEYISNTLLKMYSLEWNKPESAYLLNKGRFSPTNLAVQIISGIQLSKDSNGNYVPFDGIQKLAVAKQVSLILKCFNMDSFYSDPYFRDVNVEIEHILNSINKK